MEYSEEELQKLDRNAKEEYVKLLIRRYELLKSEEELLSKNKGSK